MVHSLQESLVHFQHYPSHYNSLTTYNYLIYRQNSTKLQTKSKYKLV